MKIVMKGDNISRSALIRQIEIDADGSPGWYGDTWQFIKTIAKMPSTDRKGHWIQKDYYDTDWNVYECDQCGEPWQLETGTPKDNHMDYCPNCGADMREAGQNER